MKEVRQFSIVFIALLTACTSTKVDVPRDHSANPAAQVTQVALTPAVATTPASTKAPATGGHQHEDDQHVGHEHQVRTPAPRARTPAMAAAPVASAGATKQADKPLAEVWTCSMHPEVAKSGPGQCPVCGMNLVKRASGKAK